MIDISRYLTPQEIVRIKAVIAKQNGKAPAVIQDWQVDLYAASAAIARVEKDEAAHGDRCKEGAA